MPNPRASHGEKLISVLLPLPLGRAYSYGVAAELDLAPGDFVSVPLGARQVSGVVWDGPAQPVAAEKLKRVSARLDAPPLPEVSRRFIEWVAAYTLTSTGAVLKMAMSVPAALLPAKMLEAFAAAESLPDLRLTPARQRVLAVLDQAPPRPAVELAREAAVGLSVVRGLAKAGALVKVELSPPPRFRVPDWRADGPRLSAAQTEAAEALRAQVAEDAFAVSLLDGVPGSGKTEVYFEAIAEVLERGRQALVLLPEIALTAQWLERFEARFNYPPAAWHSDLTPAERRDGWRAIAGGQARVVIGARSALFLPFPDLGLIVVDEEHDASFKQDDGVIYNARDMAVVRARLGALPITLVTATPSLETMRNADTGRYRRLELPARHGGSPLPEIQLVDLRADPPERGRWISPALRAAMSETFAAGEQVMLFLNRRGYAPLTLCRVCGHRLHCPRCTAWLVEHRLSGRLQCHHCGYHAGLPETCPSCTKEDSFHACGPGVERLAEEAGELFPDRRQTIAASDTVNSPSEAAQLVAAIEQGRVDLIIGTQIIAKGYHFPMLTLVGVVDGDLGLAGGDLRAAERTFQLLFQVAGRAGRAERPGRVLLQTWEPGHGVMRALAGGDRDGFLEAEAKDRQAAGMPPFGRLVAILLSGRDEGEVDAQARAMRRAAPGGDDLLILGPAPAPLSLLRGRHRRRLLLKAHRRTNVQEIMRAWLAATPRLGKVRIQLDVDPYNFL